jgi:flagellar basal-body rod protein FlgC
MSDFSILDISATGMAVEKLRMHLTAVNMANVNTTQTKAGEVYKPLIALTSPKQATEFDSLLAAGMSSENIPAGVQVDSVVEQNLQPRAVYEPSHPDADSHGFVYYPNINPVNEMLNLVTITRSYEANARAFNAARKMMQAAMEIGS